MGFKLDENAGLFPQGMHLVEVDECVQKFSKAGDGMFAVKMRDVYSNDVFWENWMMEGKGQGMTVPKVRALGLDVANIIEAGDLVGRRMVVKVTHKDSEAFGTQAQVSKAWTPDGAPADWHPPSGEAQPKPSGLKTASGEDAESQPF